MKALVMSEPGAARIENVEEPQMKPGEALLRVRRVGLCGSDLNSFRGRNPLVSFPRIPGHEVAATIVSLSEAHPHFSPGMDVTLSPYTSCGECAACLCRRHNACKSNQTLGVQRDGALTEYISVPVEKLYTANLTLKELCLVEPLTVGFHAVARARITESDTVAIFGCGGVGLGAVAASAFRGATTIAIDIDDAKLQIARLAGAAHTIHSRRQSVSEALTELTGGYGPNAYDKMQVLSDWVEKGKAPDQIIASHSTAGKVDRTMPLCPYPELAKYKGTGDIMAAENFVCAKP